MPESVESSRSKKGASGQADSGRANGGSQAEHGRGHNASSNPGFQTEAEYFEKQVDVLKEKSRRINCGIVKPQEKEFYPSVFTPMTPYNSGVTLFEKALGTSNAFSYKSVSRNTAIGLCDPWTSLEMDQTFETPVPNPAAASRSSSAATTTRGCDTEKNNGSNSSRKGTPSGDRIPLYPIVSPEHSKLAGKEFNYSDVSRLRNEITRTSSANADRKIEREYKRVKDEFYRRHLDRMEEYHKQSRPRMRDAYFAYLQNNPGSKKAVRECVNDEDKKGKKKKQDGHAKTVNNEKENGNTHADGKSNPENNKVEKSGQDARNREKENQFVSDDDGTGSEKGGNEKEDLLENGSSADENKEENGAKDKVETDGGKSRRQKRKEKRKNKKQN